MTLPLVTMMICTYNGERYLAAALDSVLAQTYPNMEVVVIDDGSRDDTVSIIEQYADRDSRIRLFARENAGLAASRNYAFVQARGEWIAIIDQDDLSYPERLARQVVVAAAYPSAGLVFCDTQYINGAGQNIGNHFASFSLPDSFIRKGLASNLLINQGCYASSAACLIRRTTVDRLGPLDESLRYACDYEYFIRAGFEVDFAYTPEGLVAWRRHAGQETRTNFNRFKELRSVLSSYFSDDRVTIGTRLSIGRNLARSLAGEAYHRARKRLFLAAGRG
jgi:glycosyltransferase involved in cell wall biosynthesis